MVGTAEIPVGDPRGFRVLDASRAAALQAWVGTLIPAWGPRPAADAVGAAEYIDATVFMVPALRPALLQAIDLLEGVARANGGKSFAGSTPEAREASLREFDSIDPSDAFNMVRDFTYEAYYGHPRVLAALESETGWSATSSTAGSVMRPFDASRLERVRSLPARWRKPGT